VQEHHSISHRCLLVIAVPWRRPGGHAVARLHYAVDTTL